MLQRLTGVLALPLLALALAATLCGAKPPDLPEKLAIIVDAPLVADKCPCPYKACPDKHVRGTMGVLAERTVLENLERLIEAGDELDKAKKHAKAGEVGAALACLAKAHGLAPGSSVAEACGEVVRVLATGGEEGTEDEEPVPCCYCEAFVRQFGLCWLWQASRMCEEACSSKAGKGVMVDGLMKSAQLALGEGRVCKARELVRQAHALDPARVEADPLVYKMGLLPMKDALGGEQPCEPRIHPKQER